MISENDKGSIVIDDDEENDDEENSVVIEDVIIPVDMNIIPKNVIDYLMESNASDNSFILQFGVYAFEKIKDIKNTHSTQSYNEEYLKEVVHHLNSQHSQKIKHIKHKYDTIIHNLKNDLTFNASHEIDLYKKKLDSTIINKDLEITSLRDNFNIKLKAFEEKYTTQIQQLNTTIENLTHTIEKKNESIHILNKEIELKNKEKIHEINSYFEQGRNLSKKDFDLFYSQILEEKKSLHDKINSYEINIQQLHKKIEDLNSTKNESILSDYNSTILSLKNDFNSIKEKLTGNSSKGDVGENIVEHFINQHFSLFSFENTSRFTAKGDFFLSNNYLKLLIENKNVQHVKTSDIEKFYRDVNINVLNGSINAALFISLNDTNLVQGKRDFVFEIKYGIPIIFISNVIENIQLIKFSIFTLLYLVENGITTQNTSNNDDFNIDLTSFISHIFQHYNTNTKILHNNKKIIESLLDNMKSQSSSFDDLYSHFNPFIIKYPQFFNKSTNNSCDLNKIFTTAKDKGISLSKFSLKTLEEIGFSKNIIQPFGKIDDLRESYKKFLHNT